jgi:hypothetical protein
LIGGATSHEKATERGHARNGGNGHHRRVRHQIHKGYRRAVRRADTAVTLVEVIGKPVTEAIERCEISPVYFYAMRAVRESGDPLLYQAVLEGHESLFTAAARVKNAAAAIKAYRKCSLFEQGMVWLATGATTDLATMLWHSTPEQLVKASKLVGTDFIWERMIVAAMPSKSITEPAAAVVQSNGNGNMEIE